MSGAPAPTAAEPDLADLPGLPREREAPVFRAPWEAQAFAIALSLHRAGVFTWSEWAEALGARLAAAAETDGARDGSDYYLRWLEALEDIAVAKGAADPGDLIATADAWSRAAAATPHGRPIELPDGRSRRDG
ncbi:MAG: nitrile hydratase accessory protein [Pseudomonadota bacterium]